jgi:hypothetical protein
VEVACDMLLSCITGGWRSRASRPKRSGTRCRTAESWGQGRGPGDDDLQTACFRTPAPDAAIVPATPDEMMCVVLTGSPENPAVPINTAPTNSAEAP